MLAKTLLYAFFRVLRDLIFWGFFMRMSKLVGRTIKESPRDAELPSHRFLVRGGFVKQYAAGIYGLMPLAMRSVAKIEKICREEMNKIEGQEVRMPCLSPKELWEESGRYSAIGKDMFRLKDRHDKDYVLNMTHEEPVVHMARTEMTSYKQYPAMLYQIQTKYRDEPRPRGGLIRTREFTMKDAYSFHTSEEDLNAYYERAHEAYMSFFRRCGAKKFVSVLSDNGMFGGRYSHEFMALVPTGEDTLITCSKCEYKANREIARSPYHLEKGTESTLVQVATPGAKTIEELVQFFNLPENNPHAGHSPFTAQHTAKAILYQNQKGELIAAFTRGDLQVEEQKLRVGLQSELFPATPEAIQRAKAVPGSTGPIGLDLGKCWVVLDPTVLGSSNLVTGANEADQHWTSFNAQRDYLDGLSDWQRSRVLLADISSARAGDPCPSCGSVLQESRGIEIGNIFHLGTKYSQSMGMTYLDAQGKAQTPIMGCYGIGISRLLPALMEEHHDEKGPLLPMPIAPFQIHLCSLMCKETEVVSASQTLYDALWANGVEVLWDDRDEKPGSQFADADLIGIPFRVIVSPKTLAQNSVEFKYRDGRVAPELVPLKGLAEKLKGMIEKELASF